MFGTGSTAQRVFVGLPLTTGRPALASFQSHFGFEGFATVLVGSEKRTRHPRPLGGGVAPPAFDLAVVLSEPACGVRCRTNVVEARDFPAALRESRLLTLYDVNPPHVTGLPIGAPSMEMP